MVRLSLSDEDFDTLMADLSLLQNFRRLAVAAPKVPNAHLIPKVQVTIEATNKLLNAIREQVELQSEPTVVVNLSTLKPPTEAPPTASVLPLKRP
jgi:hypothetical protein